jgi:hypothetical protein
VTKKKQGKKISIFRYILQDIIDLFLSVEKPKEVNLEESSVVVCDSMEHLHFCFDMVPFTVAGGAVSSKSDRRLFAVLPLGVFSFKRYSRDCYLKKKEN